MSRGWWGGAVGALLLTGCIEDQASQDLSVSLPVAGLLVAVPIVLLVVAGRWMRCWWRRWPVVIGLDGRVAIAVLPLAAAGIVAAYVWLYATITVAVGYTRPKRDLFSWGEMTALAAWMAGAVVVIGLLAMVIGVGIVRHRPVPLAVALGAGVLALAGQMRLIAVTEQSRPAWVIAVCEATYVLVVASLWRQARRPASSGSARMRRDSGRSRERSGVTLP